MAGWIVWTKGLVGKDEICRIARELGISRREAACRCMEVWEWADERTTNGFVPHVRLSEISDIVGFPGLAEAMAIVGWLQEHIPAGVNVANYDRWNAESAKARLHSAERMRRFRSHHARKGTDDAPNI